MADLRMTVKTFNENVTDPVIVKIIRGHWLHLGSAMVALAFRFELAAQSEPQRRHYRREALLVRDIDVLVVVEGGGPQAGVPVVRVELLGHQPRRAPVSHAGVSPPSPLGVPPFGRPHAEAHAGNVLLRNHQALVLGGLRVTQPKLWFIK